MAKKTDAPLLAFASVEQLVELIAEAVVRRLPPAAPTQPAAPVDEWLNTREAAKHLRLSLSTLEAYRKQGSGPVFSKMGVAVRYNRDDLDRWAKGRRRGS